nr:hypothetical protein [Tanacetum cinerariifolium]
PPFKTARSLCNKFKGDKDKVMLALAIRVMLLVSREIMHEGKQGLLNVIIVKVKDTWLGNALSLRGQGTLHGLRTRQCWLKHKNLTKDLDAYDFDCDDVSTAQAVLMANLSNYGSDVISEATIQDGKVTVQQVQGRQGQSYAGTGYKGEGHMARQCTQPKRPRNAAWFKDKAMLAEAQESGQILNRDN